jgi:hypothetical protein
MTSYNLNTNHGYFYGMGLTGPLATLVVMGVHLKIGGAK